MSQPLRQGLGTRTVRERDREAGLLRRTEHVLAHRHVLHVDERRHRYELRRCLVTRDASEMCDVINAAGSLGSCWVRRVERVPCVARVIVSRGLTVMLHNLITKNVAVLKYICDGTYLL